MNKLSRQKFNKETWALNDTLDQLDLIGIYRAFHPKAVDFSFLSIAYGIFSRIDYIWSHTSSFGKL